MNQPINQLEGKIQALINKYQELKEKNAKVAEQNRELENTLADRNKVIQGFETQLRELTQVCNDREEENLRLQIEIETMKEKLDSYETTTKDAAGRIDSILSQIEDL